MSDLASAIAGTGPGRPVLASPADLAALASALGVIPGRNVRLLDPAGIRAAIAGNPAALGLLRADDVTPDVRALAVDGIALFGVGRTHDLAAWPLAIAGEAGGPAQVLEPGAAWTLAAGGDVMLDRAPYRVAVLDGRGPDFPWRGGTAAIARRTCCGWMGSSLVVGRRTGHPGAVRRLLDGADVTLANLEGPAPRDFVYHPHGLTFTMDPGLLTGLDHAGIDAVSLGNNHISNAGPRGIRQTIRALDRLAISHAGAGDDVLAARRPAWLTAGGLRIAVLSADAVATARRATRRGAGAAPLRVATLRADIRAARDEGADVVIVMPHWGREYSDRVTAVQRRMARDLVAAGADVVLGSHSHWAGPVELIDGHLVVYSMGDLVFDLQHDARTQQGIILELTFVGGRLAQVELHPTLILDRSQPNLLEADGGGDALLRAIRAASARLDR